MVQAVTPKGERTRSAILSAAQRLFVKQGYHGTSMRQIANQASIALGGIYNHFRNKEAIFLAVLDAYHPYHEIIPALEAAQGETLESFVRDAAESMIAALEKRPEFIHLMFIEIVEFNSTHIPRLFETIYPRVAAVISQFIPGSGELRPLPLIQVVRAFIGLFFSFYMSEILLRQQLPSPDHTNARETFVDIFLHGVLSRDHPSQAGSQPDG